jgi:hypothetical protein
VSLIARRAAIRAALFLLLSFPLACREGAEPASSDTAVTLQLQFTPGERFFYDAWVINEYGYLLSATRTRSLWRVLNVTTGFNGFSLVTTILDSASILRNGTAVLDTLSLAVGQNGDVYRFGFLAQMARIRKTAEPPRLWDRIAALSIGSGTSWLVGYLDTGGKEPVYGRVSGAPELFSVQVNSVQTVYAGIRVDLSGPTFNYSYWLSDAPTSFLRFRLEPDNDTTGAEIDLSEIRSQP